MSTSSTSFAPLLKALVGGLSILNFLLLPTCILSSTVEDKQYAACKPFECGGVTISHPFFDPSKQPSNCGWQRFRVSCNNDNQTTIKLSSDEYIINNISYSDQSVNITNSAFSSSVFRCPSSIHNLTLTGGGGFNYTDSKLKHILLLQNCTRNITNSSKNYTQIKCNETLNQAPYWAVYEDDFNQGEFGECGKQVKVPYEEGQNENSTSIDGILRRGIVLKYISNDCSHCEESGGRCGLDQTTFEYLCLCPDRPHRSSCLVPGNNSKLKGKLILGTIFSAIAGSIVITLVLIVNRRRRHITWDNQNVETVLENYGSAVPQRFAYSNIKKMTNTFAEKLGEGGYGSVYKGKMLDGRLVAVKLLKNSKCDGEGFINEVASIGRTNHVNIVTLLGFCCKGDKRALVYEYMENGSLEKYINGRTNNGQSLSLERLFQIVLGIARGLEYLHRGCKTRILHFDIKPHNILLDEEFCPKISDFGLAKLTPQTKQSNISMSGARGTIGYIAPEVFSRAFGDVSHKSDVYSFGMMVLEAIGSTKIGTTNADSSSEVYFPQWIYKQLEHEEELESDITMNDNDKEVKRKMIIVSLWCIQPVPSSRPSMSRVIQMLEASVETIEIPSMPSLSSPPRPQTDSSWSSTMS